MNVLRIKEILKEKGISIKEFAKITDLSYTYASEIVRNAKFPRKETLILIADALDIDIKDLFYSTLTNSESRKDIYIKNDKGEFEKIGSLNI